MADSTQRTVGHSLNELAPNSRFIGQPDILFNACCTDWRQCRPGDLYVAMEVNGQDGHDDVEQAIENGATAVLAERYLITSVPVCVVKDTREIYGRICQRLAGDPSTDMSVIGVTGTNGKTVTSHLIQAILNEAGHTAGIISSIESNDGFQSTTSGPAMPGPAQLASDLSRMAMNGCTHAIVEASSCGLAQKQLAGVRLDVAVITNMRRDHLDFHGNVRNYRNAKMRMLRQLSTSGFAIMNGDDRATQAMLTEVACPTITVGIQSDAEICATLVDSFGSEQTFLLHAGNQSIPVRTAMIGEQHVRNCLSAAAVALVLGIDLATIVRGLESVTCLPGRMQRLECGQPFGVFVDIAGTPDQLASSLRALRNNYSGKIHCVFGSSDRTADHHGAWIGKVLERSCDRPIITGCNENAAKSLAKSHELLDGFDRPAVAHLIPNRAAAIEYALQQAAPGDCVLIAGQGERPSHQIKSESSGELLITDADVGQNWLYEVGAKKEYTSVDVPAVMSYRLEDFRS